MKCQRLAKMDAEGNASIYNCSIPQYDAIFVAILTLALIIPFSRPGRRGC